jgi:hypothetical protein
MFSDQEPSYIGSVVADRKERDAVGPYIGPKSRGDYSF